MQGSMDMRKRGKGKTKRKGQTTEENYRKARKKGEKSRTQIDWQKKTSNKEEAQEEYTGIGRGANRSIFP